MIKLLSKINLTIKNKFKSCNNNDFDSVIFLTLNNFFDSKYNNVDLKKLKNLDNQKTKIIFDVGAHLGESIERFKKIFPNYKIFAFEPVNELFNEIKKKHENEKVKVFNYAIDSINSEKNFFIYKKTKSSSLKKVTNKEWLNKKIKYAETNQYENPTKIDFKGFTKEQKVKTICLDNFVEKLGDIKSIDLLKIDIQGNEKEALIGSENLLKKQLIKIVEIEIIVGNIYHSEQLLNINKILDKYGYKFIAIDKASNIISNKNYYFNILFVNQEIYEKLMRIQ